MTLVPTPDPGIYESVSFETYLAWDAISNSRLNLFRRSPAHFKANVAIEQTPSIRLGTLTHCGRFEPLELAKRFAVMPPFENDPANVTEKGEQSKSKITKYYRAKSEQFATANADKTIVPAAEYDKMVAMVTNLGKHDRAREFLENADHCELAIVWDDLDTGLRCKARLDAVSFKRRKIGDLKTYTAQQGYRMPVDKFARAIASFGYHRQMAHYQYGVSAIAEIHCDTGIVAIENAAPYCVMGAAVGEAWLEIGRREVADTLRAIADCFERDEWPGYESPVEWPVPAFYGADEEIELLIGGESVVV